MLVARFPIRILFRALSNKAPDFSSSAAHPEPIAEFKDTGFPEPIIKKLELKYEKPSSIQASSWPVVMSGRDLISVAKTGSGKTLAFILPAIVHTMNSPRRPPGGGPTALVVAPTRELAQQIHSVTLEYGPMMQRSSTCLFGGVSRSGQEIILERGVDICISTPGRLLDFLASGVTSLSRCSYLVLDEADRMLDMGFEPQIREIVNQIPSKRQTMMFSATWPEDVRELAGDFHTDPVFLNDGSSELVANHNIEQIVEVMGNMDKLDRLSSLLESLLKEKNAKILIFVETKSKADALTRSIMRIGWRAVSIHGGKTQMQRDSALNDFRNGRMPILLATDVAARGLDVQDIKTVINFDFPNNTENYVHRIGRTGRQDKKGTAYTFFTPQDAVRSDELIRILEEANQNVPKELLALRWGDRPKQVSAFRSSGRPGGFSNNSGYQKQGGYNNRPYGQSSGRKPSYNRY